ncbi:hypothetical protein [Streptomyces tropicalis]|uniref:Uncharacterized protein n=1 Tax=Streptomyces tropicalis TaxID=3034234 RepID=A0ABT6A657_9ACTN|nr:hypothetical protein [Streptomyces tropicalis]MDF3300130.1 hypothetical protein [Streptomyces tropicalis]
MERTISADGASAGGTPDLRAIGLALIADGIDRALSELGKLGLIDDAGRSGTGRGFDDLEMDGMTVGDETVGAAFHSFCERWQWGVRALIDEGNAFAAGVGLAAGTMYQTDQTVENSFKVGLNSLEGNPYASEQQIDQEGWGQLATPGWLHPDYSEKSFRNGLTASEQSLKGMGRDLATAEAVPGVEVAPTLAGMDEDQYNAALDATFGPQQEGQG